MTALPRRLVRQSPRAVSGKGARGGKGRSTDLRRHPRSSRRVAVCARGPRFRHRDDGAQDSLGRGHVLFRRSRLILGCWGALRVPVASILGEARNSRRDPSGTTPMVECSATCCVPVERGWGGATHGRIRLDSGLSEPSFDGTGLIWPGYGRLRTTLAKLGPSSVVARACVSGLLCRQRFRAHLNREWTLKSPS